jgi:hypothetical protein
VYLEEEKKEKKKKKRFPTTVVVGRVLQSQIEQMTALHARLKNILMFSPPQHNREELRELVPLGMFAVC